VQHRANQTEEMENGVEILLLRQTISIDELTVKHIEEIDRSDVWNTPDKTHPNRPSFYCLEIRRR
jgi:ATP sulfurylase